MSKRQPMRIQRRRTKGWKMPEGAVYVGRPTIFGNPFVIDGDAALAVIQFRRWLTGKSATGGGGLRRISVFSQIDKLRGKDLACWCPLIDKDGNRVPCHADVLLELANA